MVQRKTKSLLQELEQLYIIKDRLSFVESKATNLIQGTINLINYIKENYTPQEAEELERRLINSIRSQDSSKFSKGIKRIKESKNQGN